MATVLGLLAARPVPAAAADAGAVYTIANYPVDATAGDAVTAKDRALSDGQQAAFRALLKRIVPVTAYSRLNKLRAVKAADLIDGVSVRSERNSATQYFASLDFSFQVEGVRNLLRREGIPFVDSQAPVVTVVPVYLPPRAGQGSVPASLAEAAGSAQWLDAWKWLDLDHALAPIKLAPAKAKLSADAIRQLHEGDPAGLAALKSESGSELVLLASAEADMAGGRLHVTLAGRDAVGPFVLKRAYRLRANDLAYTAELATIVVVGTLEGRWKAFKERWSPDGPYTGGAAPVPVQILVEVRTIEQWQDIRRLLQETPGVEDLQVGGISARGADVALRYPGGGAQLADALQARGLEMHNASGVWRMRAAN